MARRKRLEPADPSRSPAPPAPPPARAPIAQVAGEAAAASALEEVSATLAAARSEGRMIEALPLEAVDAGHLVRDRLALEGEDFDTLKRSLAARGQQMPVEVVALKGGRYGLVSGWRRFSALKALLAETGEARFARIEARLVTPEDRAGAYLAMVEENEIRTGLSFYERARIVWKAEEDGAYPDRRAALQGLFGNVPRARRSKIGSFTRLVAAFDADLRFPTAIPEKLGLRLVKALDTEKGFAARLRRRLKAAGPAGAAEELAVLNAALAPPKGAPTPLPPLTARFDAKKARIEIAGEGVDEALYAALQDWLASRR